MIAVRGLVSIVYSYKRVGKMNTIASAASEVVPGTLLLSEPDAILLKKNTMTMLFLIVSMASIIARDIRRCSGTLLLSEPEILFLEYRVDKM